MKTTNYVGAVNDALSKRTFSDEGINRAVRLSNFGLPTVERTMSQRASHFFAITIYIVLTITMLVTIAIGTLVFLKLSNDREIESTFRAESNSLVNTVRFNDQVDSIRTGNGPEGKALILRETLDTGSYDTCLYLYNGNIVEEYLVADASLTPDRASVISSSGTFDFDYEDGLLSITTDSGTTQIALRCSQGGV